MAHSLERTLCRMRQSRRHCRCNRPSHVRCIGEVKDANLSPGYDPGFTLADVLHRSAGYAEVLCSEIGPSRRRLVGNVEAEGTTALNRPAAACLPSFLVTSNKVGKVGADAGPGLGSGRVAGKLGNPPGLEPSTGAVAGG
jgi:hypothetical protein